MDSIIESKLFRLLSCAPPNLIVLDTLVEKGENPEAEFMNVQFRWCFWALSWEVSD